MESDEEVPRTEEPGCTRQEELPPWWDQDNPNLFLHCMLIHRLLLLPPLPLPGPLRRLSPLPLPPPLPILPPLLLLPPPPHLPPLLYLPFLSSRHKAHPRLWRPGDAVLPSSGLCLLHSPIPTSFIGMDGTIIQVNYATRQFSGYSPEQLRGRSSFMFMCTSTAATRAAKEQFVQWLAAKQPTTVSMGSTYFHKKGHTVKVRGVTSIVFDSDDADKPVGVISFWAPI